MLVLMYTIPLLFFNWFCGYSQDKGNSTDPQPTLEKWYGVQPWLTQLLEVDPTLNCPPIGLPEVPRRGWIFRRCDSALTPVSAARSEFWARLCLRRSAVGDYFVLIDTAKPLDMNCSTQGLREPHQAISYTDGPI